MAEKTSHAETRTRGEGSFFHKPSKKTIFGSAAVLLLAILIFGAVSTGLPERFFGARTVTFTQLKKDEIPQTIETDVIPEYRELERALGCLVNGKVYVVVTRGEKPTAGYDLAIVFKRWRTAALTCSSPRVLRNLPQEKAFPASLPIRMLSLKPS